MKKRIISALLVLSMMLALLPTTALAEDSARPAEPMLTGLTVLDKNGKIVSLLDNNETTTVSLGEIYTFEVSFSNAEQIHKVYITSTKGNEKVFLETTFNENKHVFVSTGFFNDDSKYIPGKIGVEYTKKTNDVKVGSSVDWGALQSALNEQCTATVDSISDEAMQATVDISKLLNEETKVAVNVAIDVFNAKSDGNLNEWLGYYHDLEAMQKRILEGGKYYLYLDDTSMETYIAMVVRDVSESRYTKIVLKEAGEYKKSLKEVAENLGTINLISGIVYDFFDIQDNVKDLRQEISRSSFILESQKAGLYTKVDEYETDRRSFSLLTALLPVVVGATGGTMAGPAIVFTALLGAVNAASSTFWDYRIGLIQGCEPIDANFVSGACGAPLTEDYHVIQSGQYYLPEGASGIYIGGDNGIPIDVTLCLHGQKVSGSIYVADGSTLHLCDCAYSENTDGSVTGGQVPNVHVRKGSSLIFEGGTITDSVTGTGGSKITIEGGTIRGGISSEDGGEIIIKRGAILGAAHGYGVSLWTDSGNIKILDGQINCGVRTNNGTIRIDDGLIGQSDTTHIRYVYNEAGVLELRGGTISGRIYNGKDGMAYISGGEVICTRLDNDNTANNYESITNDGGNITITGGIFKGIGKYGGYETSCIENREGGTLTITGGTFQSSEGVCIENGGKLSISNGTFSSLGTVISNGGEAIIAGGALRSVEDVCVANGDTLTISNGYFEGTYGISDYRSNGNKLLISSDSVIEINATKAAFHSDSGAKIVIEADADYNGGITYYNSPNAQGSKKTIQEAASIDYEQPYVCLAADDATGGLSGGSITLPDGIKDALADGTAVFAASYRGDKLVECVRGTVKDGTAVFSRKIPAGWTLFFLNPVSLTPLCKPIVL